MVDVVCAATPVPGTRVHAGVSVAAGGSAVNASLAAAAAGATACVVGRIGSDAPGDLVESALRGRGIETRLARDAELPTGVAVALGLSPTAVVAQRGANARLAPDDDPASIDGTALIVSGFVLLQPGSSDAGRAALDRFTGEWAGVDLGSPKLAAASDLDELARSATAVFATADEAHAATGTGPVDAVRALAGRFRLACVKLGPEGAIAAMGEQVERGAAPRVERRSPFGAGDAFTATLLVALAQGDALVRGLERACAAGAAAAAASR